MKYKGVYSNYEAAGYYSPEEFVKSTSESEKDQLAVFVDFINSDSVLRKTMLRKKKSGRRTWSG
ncbi:TPA: DUF3380 domain-containing protein [Citrobacter farmeri]|uniref:N-acetylmuramidase domain-containing protein n=1 Tax=Citrobacter farmeri TaxID=67824 RepID=UPI00388FE0FF|nr:DUF3380 domain-containing protein [Citrobacter farmeri]